MASSFDSRRMAWFTARVRRDDLETLGQLLESGAIRPVIESTHSLGDVPEVLRMLGAGHSLGKRVIVV